MVENDPYLCLKELKIKNVHSIIYAHLNINSLRNKFDQLKGMIVGVIDVLVITETKLNDSFPNSQFFIEGYSKPYRFDRKENGGGGVLIYIREDIPSKLLELPSASDGIESIFIEINLRKMKWLIGGAYISHKNLAPAHLEKISIAIDSYLCKYDNILLMGDFNCEMTEQAMKIFCDTYSFRNLIKHPTCFKNPNNPSCIDLILTNKSKSFINSQVVETGLSDHHKMCITVSRTHLPKMKHNIVTYRSYKHFKLYNFRNELGVALSKHNDVCYEDFENIFLKLLNKHAPMKRKIIRANEAPFMNKDIKKSIMNRTRLRNKYLKFPSATNKDLYKRQRNLCTSLIRKHKKTYYSNLDIRNISDNKKFWSTVKPFFSDKTYVSHQITLINDNSVVYDNKEIAETFNEYFSTAAVNLGIEKDFQFLNDTAGISDPITKAIIKYENHPSIIKIKETYTITDKFNFSAVSPEDIQKIVNPLDVSKASSYKSIPTKIFKQNFDIFSGIITKIYNQSTISANFPPNMKFADVCPIHKKNDYTDKTNYRPVSLLPSVSKVFERLMSGDISSYIDKFLSHRLCGFRRGYSTQLSLIVMLEYIRENLDKGNFTGMLLTDLSKAFDCLVHDLLIAKLNAYGFDYNALRLIDNYLSDRKQRTKIGEAYSSWTDIILGVPQGSILGPLLFNIYINDIFCFTEVTTIANFADDNTPYICDKSIDLVLSKLEKDSKNLNHWFKTNYLKSNEDKCQLLLNINSKLFIKVGNENVYNSAEVKLLGISFDSALKFDDHVSKLCKKANQKLHALLRVASFMNYEKRRNIMKSFITSQFSYCPLVWMFHSRGSNDRINKIHERALRSVYNDTTSTFEELLIKDNSVNIHHRNLQVLATEIYKAINDLSPPILKSIFHVKNNPYNLRRGVTIRARNVKSVRYGTETLSFRGPKVWAIVPDDIKNSTSLIEFKSKIKKWRPIGCDCKLCCNYVQNLGYVNRQ